MQAVARKSTRQGEYDSRVDTAVSYVNRADATVPEVTHLQRTGVVTNRPYSECPPYHLNLRQRWGRHHLNPLLLLFLAWWGMYMP